MNTLQQLIDELTSPDELIELKGDQLLPYKDRIAATTELNGKTVEIITDEMFETQKFAIAGDEILKYPLKEWITSYFSDHVKIYSLRKVIVYSPKTFEPRVGYLIEIDRYSLAYVRPKPSNLQPA